MKTTAKKYLSGVAALALFGGLAFVTPQTLQARQTANNTVHVTVNVHGSDIGVSSEVLEETVDKLLEAADIHVAQHGGSSVTELKIDIFKNDDGHGFKADANWDEDAEPEIEKHCAAQDEIDSIVEQEVNAFINFIHHA